MKSYDPVSDRKDCPLRPIGGDRETAVVGRGRDGTYFLSQG